MSLLFLDSFDDRTSAAMITAKYDTSSGTPVSVAGRTGNGLNLPPSSYLRKSIPASTTTIVGAAIKMGSANSSTMLQILSGTTVLCSLFIDFNMAITIFNGASAVIAGPTANGIMSTSSFKYVEWKVVHSATVGSVTVKIDGTTLLTATGLNTGTSANVVGLGQTGGSTSNNYFDDFYIANDAGAVNNDFLGTINIECLFPTGAGNTTGWTIGGSSPAATNWQSVNDTDPNDGTTLVTNTAVGVKDTYQTANLVATVGVVVGVQTQVRALATNPGSGTLKKVLRSSGADYLGAAKTLTSAYADYQEIDEVDPATSATWTLAGVNAVEIGIQSA